MSWWSENRLWLPAVPLALAALLGASAYNVKTFWWDEGLHHETASASPGAYVEVTDEFTDALGSDARTFEVRLSGVSPVGEYPFYDGPGAPPKGIRALVADLEWKADPDQVMSGCSVALVDDEGRSYEITVGDDQANVCVPFGHEGPAAALTSTSQRGEVADDAERPPAWSTAPVFLVPEGRTITRVLVWWDRPDYLALTVP